MEMRHLIGTFYIKVHQKNVYHIYRGSYRWCDISTSAYSCPMATWSDDCHGNWEEYLQMGCGVAKLSYGYRNDPCRLYNRAFHDRCCFTGNGWTTTIYVLDDVIINALVLRDSVNHLKDFQIGFPVGIAGKYTRWDDTNHYVGRRDERH